MKAIVGGIASRSSQPAAGTTPPVNIYTVNVNWSALQTSQGGAIAANNAIDSAITWAQNNNGFVRIRLMAGFHCPGWALNLDGTHMVLQTNDAPSLSVPRFWGPNYLAAYQDLQNKLAAKYDSVDVVRLVFASLTMIEYAEPLQRFWAKGSNASIYTAAGYTVALDKAAVLAGFQAHASAWTQTATGFSYNPMDSDNASYQWAIDDQIATFGTETQVQNNSIGNCGSLNTNYHNMYAAMQASGAYVSFQSSTPSNLCAGQTALTAMDTALSYGASCFELIDDYATSVTPTQQDDYNTAFLANLPQGGPGVPVSIDSDWAGVTIPVTSPGTRVQGPNYSCAHAVVIADPGNANYVVFGGADVHAENLHNRGFKLVAGQVSPRISLTNLNQLYFDSLSANDKFLIAIIA